MTYKSKYMQSKAATEQTGGFKSSYMQNKAAAKQQNNMAALPSKGGGAVAAQRSLDQIKTELTAAQSAEKSAMGKIDEYMLTYSGALDLRDPAELETLKSAATAATKERERLEQEYNAHSGSFEDKFGEMSRFGKAMSSIVSTPFLAADVVAQTAKSAISGDNNMDMDTLAMQKYEQAQKLKESATEGMSGAGKFLADTGMSIAQNLYALPMNAILPGGALLTMGATSAADKMHELGSKGESATRSLVRGAASGAIEAATEKLPLDTLADLVKTGGKGAVKNLLKQSGIEATEEGIAYTLNWAADKLAKDPDAKWDANEFWNAVASGGASGLFFGLGGTAANRVNSVQGAMPGSGLDGTPAAQSGRLPFDAKTAEEQIKAKTLPTEDGAAVQAAPSATPQTVTLPGVDTSGRFGAVEGQKNTASTGETESTAVNTNPAQHTAAEQAIIEEYQSETDEALKSTFESYFNDPKQGFSRHNISTVSERQASDAAKLLGGEYKGYKNAINSNGIQHILNEHGPNGSVDNSLSDLNDIARMGYVLDNYDAVEVVTYESGEADLSREFRTQDNRPAPMLKFSKKVNGTYYVVEAIPESKHKKFWVVSAYMQKADSGTQALDANGPETTPKASLASSLSTSDTNVPQAAPGVNGQYMQGSADVSQSETDGYWDSIMQEGALPFMESDVDGYVESLLEAVDQQLGRATPKDTPVTEEFEPPAKGKKRAKKSPSENASVKEIVNDPEVSGSKSITGDFAQALASSGVSYNKDLARNLDAAAGGSTVMREKLRTLIERPFLAAKANYANNVRSQLNDLKKTMDALGIKKGSKESAAVQRYGEGQYQDETGEVHEYTEAMLREEFPDTWQNIVKAAQYCRQVYDSFVDRINETLSKIYPNPMGKAMEDEAKYTSRASFFSEMVKEQQNTLDSLQERLTERKGQLGRVREGTQRYADLQNTIHRIERQVETVQGKISSLQEQVDISNAKATAVHSRIVSGEVLRNKQLLKRPDYFHHFNEMAEGWAGLANILNTPSDINSTLAGTSDFTQPKSKWAGFMQGRKGGAYTEDAVGGLLAYIPQAEYKINLDPIIAENRNIIKTLAEETEDTRNANKFIEWMTDWTNDLAGKTNPFDRAVQKVVGRKTISVAKWLSSRAKANAVVGNVRSATAQAFNLPNALVYVKSPKAWKNGAKIYGRALGGDETAKSLYAESGFLSERYMDDVISQFDEGMLKKPEKFANWMLTVGDKEVAKLIWASAYEQGRAQGAADPVEYADDITRRSIGGRGVGEVPLLQKSTLTQLFAPFQVEVNNTWQLMKEAGADKNWLGLLAMFALSFLMNSATRELLGYDVGIDPFNAVIDGIKDWDEEQTAAGNLVNIAGRVGGEVLSNMPFGAQIGSIAVSDEMEREKLFGDADPSRFGTGNIGIDALADTVLSGVEAIKEKDVSKLDLMTPLTNFALPYGGKQVGRLIEGGQDLGLLPVMDKDGLALQPDAGSKTDNGGLRFAVDEKNPADVAKLLTLGPFSTKGGMEYLEEGYTALGKAQTSAAMEAAKAGVDLVDYMAAYRGMSKVEKEAEKRAVIRNMDLTDEEKAYIYRYAMLASDAKEKERGVFDTLVDGGSDAGLIGNTLMSIKDAEKQKGKLQAIGAAGVSEREARELFGLVMDTDLKTEEGNATAYAKLLDAMNTALGVQEVVELKNSDANLDRFLGYTDAGMDAGAAYDLSLAAVEMRKKENIEGTFDIKENARWIESAGLTRGQREIAWLVTYPEWAEKADKAGVSNWDYITYKKATYGLTKKADKLQALRDAGYTATEAAQIYDKIN